ncbi:Ig-like domain-containing protein [Deinococcus cellulosilyticus]|uniref:SbsA Ig-like domain-containing protein n=1 Tax=Deinococcus cellulosilyticus (strain DSM 18568 / NBRC 106333 / KACC 11606 / 5516J-15) TaxID=1223518 RepID=A0A511N7R4_DEIC1|nr:Ig-like domain-containing protein [Deinococcus cellulosilyticus]GEM48547.1 hypothetical protein DC3_41820 [Deinococcus cellulosilyticus NBRC 106333 = KACC 11606]
MIHKKLHPFMILSLALTFSSCSTTYVNPTKDPDPGPPVVDVVADSKFFLNPVSGTGAHTSLHDIDFVAQLRFSETMNIGTVEKSILLLDSQNQVVPLKLTYKSDLYNYRASTSVEVKPQKPLAYNQTYQLKVLKTAEDITGQALVQEKQMDFTTEKAPVQLRIEKSVYAFGAGEPTYTLTLKNVAADPAQKVHLWTRCENSFSQVEFRFYLPQLASQASMVLTAEVFGGQNIGGAKQVVCKTQALAESQDREVWLLE